MKKEGLWLFYNCYRVANPYFDIRYWTFLSSFFIHNSMLDVRFSMFVF